MVSRKGFEPMTLRLGILRSIQLSYQDYMVPKVGLEPTQGCPY